MAETVTIFAGVSFYVASFKRLDTPYSIVLDWCNEHFGIEGSSKKEYYSSMTAKAKTIRWMEDGSNFYFKHREDFALFTLTWS